MQQHARFLFGLSLVFPLLVATAAGAQVEGDDKEPPPPARWPKRLHLELGAGPGFFRGSAGSAADERSFTGVVLSTELLVGGQLGRGFTLGAGYLRDDIFAISSEDEVIDGDEPSLDDAHMSLGLASWYCDWHPFQNDGLHVRASIGIGNFRVKIPAPGGSPFATATKSSDFTFGWSFGLGYHRRVAGALSVGVLARVMGASFDGGVNSETDVDVLTPSLLFTLGGR